MATASFYTMALTNKQKLTSEERCEFNTIQVKCDPVTFPQKLKTSVRLFEDLLCINVYMCVVKPFALSPPKNLTRAKFAANVYGSTDFKKLIKKANWSCKFPSGA